MEPETAKDAASGRAGESIQFTCHICHVSKMDTLHGLGLHLKEKHQIQGDAVEIPEEGTCICEKATQKVLATWEE
jgi:hypothetical protein